MRLLVDSRMGGKRTAYLLGLVLIAVLVTLAYVAAGVNSQTANQCLPKPASPAAAPVQGYQYFVYYNSSNGAIVSIVTIQSCEVGGKLPGVAPIKTGYVAVLNVTTSTAIPTMMPDGFLNAYYVNLHSMQITIIPGVSFVDSHHAFYNGQPITNGTRLPIPNT